MGVVCGCVYLIFMFLFIPVPLSGFIVENEQYLFKGVSTYLPTINFGIPDYKVLPTKFGDNT